MFHLSNYHNYSRTSFCYSRGYNAQECIIDCWVIEWYGKWWWKFISYVFTVSLKVLSNPRKIFYYTPLFWKQIFHCNVVHSGNGSFGIRLVEDGYRLRLARELPPLLFWTISQWNIKFSPNATITSFSLISYDTLVKSGHCSNYYDDMMVTVMEFFSN